MDTLSYKTVSPNAQSVEREWVVIDATDQVLGRLCAKVAKILRGKHKPTYSPNVECGDNVIIINADKIILTGKKMTDKEYIDYTGYPGGQRIKSPADLMAKGADRLLLRVVKGMLPKNKLGAQLLRNLRVYGGAEHDHAAQNPKTIDINLYK